jgi:hypothetical protein
MDIENAALRNPERGIVKGRCRKRAGELDSGFVCVADSEHFYNEKGR